MGRLHLAGQNWSLQEGSSWPENGVPSACSPQTPPDFRGSLQGAGCSVRPHKEWWQGGGSRVGTRGPHWCFLSPGLDPRRFWKQPPHGFSPRRGAAGTPPPAGPARCPGPARPPGLRGRPVRCLPPVRTSPPTLGVRFGAASPPPRTLLQLWLPTEGGSCTQRGWSGGEAVASEEPTRLSYPRGGDAGGSRGAGAAHPAGFGMEVEQGGGFGGAAAGGGAWRCHGSGCPLLSLLPACSCFSHSQGRRKKVPPDGVKLVDEVSSGGGGQARNEGGAPGIPARA